MEVENTSEQKLRLALQTALLGEVIPQIIFVTGDIRGDWITVRFHLDGPISEKDREDLDTVSTEVIAHYPAPMKVETVFTIGKDWDLPESHEMLVYLRKRAEQYR